MRIKHLLCLFALFTGITTSAAPACALSDETLTQIRGLEPAFVEVENGLEKALNRLQRAVSPTEWMHYRAVHDAWLDKGRDNDMLCRLLSFDINFMAGPAEALSDAGHPSVARAATLVTMEWAKALNMMATQAQDPAFLLSLAGSIRFVPASDGGTFFFMPYNWHMPFQLCTMRETERLSADMRAFLQTLQNSDSRESATIILTGHLRFLATYLPDQAMKVAPLGEGMAWRELDNWDDFDM